MSAVLAIPAFLAAGALFVLVACGPTTYEYVTNADTGTFVRVPQGWHTKQLAGPARFGMDARDVSPEMLRELAGREWLVGLDAAATFDDSALVVPDAAEPKGFVQARRLLPEEAAALSTNDLRNLFVDVEAAAAAQAEAIRHDPYQARLAPSFLLLVDDLTRQDGGVHGVHLVYQLRTSAGLVTIDQTSLLDQDQTILYQLVLACASWCYEQRADELASVRDSFTVRPAD